MQKVYNTHCQYSNDITVKVDGVIVHVPATIFSAYVNRLMLNHATQCVTMLITV